MTREQSAARALFASFGFDEEAVLRDEIRDRQGGLHDLVTLSLLIDDG